MAKEEWRDIPGLKGYQASSLGRIRSKLKWPYVIIKPVENLQDGYYQFTYCHQGQNKGAKSYMRAVAVTWLGPPPEPAMRPMPKNGKRDDFRPDNLYWGFWGDERERRDIEQYGLSRRSCIYCDGGLPANRPRNRVCSKCSREYRRQKDVGRHREWAQEKVGLKSETRSHGLGYPPSQLSLIRKYLRTPDWSNRDGADRAGVTSQTFSRWVNNYRRAKGMEVPKAVGEEAKLRRAAKARRVAQEKKTRKAPPETLRREAAEYAVKHSARKAAEKYGYAERTIVRWKSRFGLSGQSELLDIHLP